MAQERRGVLYRQYSTARKRLVATRGGVLQVTCGHNGVWLVAEIKTYTASGRNGVADMGPTTVLKGRMRQDATRP